MREKLESLPLAQIRAIAKEHGIPRITSTRKSQLIEEILRLEGELEGESGAQAPQSAETAGAQTSQSAEATDAQAFAQQAMPSNIMRCFSSARKVDSPFA